MSVSYSCSFADAKMLEDRAENFVGRDRAACDFGEMEETFAEILRDEVAREASGHALANAADVGEGGREGRVVASVRDDDVARRFGLRLGEANEGFGEAVEGDAFLRTDVESGEGKEGG